MAFFLLKEKRSLFRNALYNFAGSAIPLVIAFISIPLLISGYGNEKYGILSIGWVLIGYFSIADFGLSRALTKFVSERKWKGEYEKLSNMIWSALFVMGAMGLICSFILVALSPTIIFKIFKLKNTNPEEMLRAFYILSIGVPFTIIAAGLRGILEGLMRFDLANYIRIALGCINFLGPLIALYFSNDVIYPITIIVFSRIIFCFVYLYFCFRVLPELKTKPGIKKSKIFPLLRYGGWISISNIISPIMVNFDRFFIGGMVSVAALAYYSTPWEIVTRLLIIPSAVSGAMFPVISRDSGMKEDIEPGLYRNSIRTILYVMFPICLVCILFSKEGLQIWLGSEFAVASLKVLKVMTVAVLINGLAQIPFTVIQGIGRPEVTAKYHIIELMIYVPMLVILIESYGILGAAWAWFIRASGDFVLLYSYCERMIRKQNTERNIGKPRNLEITIVISFGSLLLSALLKGLFIRAFTATILLGITGVIVRQKISLGNARTEYHPSR